MKNNKGILTHYEKYWQEYKQTSQVTRTRGVHSQQRFFLNERSDQLVALFKKSKCTSIINCGCGSGIWSIPFAEAGFKVMNFDYSEGALDITSEAFREKELTGSFMRGNLLNLPVKEDTFDVVISFGLLEHFQDIEAVMKEMVRILKPGGIFLSDVITKRFSVHSIQEMINLVISIAFNLARIKFDNIKLAITNYKGSDFYENSYSFKFYERKARDCGLRNVVIKGIRPFPLIVLPSFIDRVYAKLLSFLSEPIKRFDNSGSKISKFWSAIWTIYGIKET